MTFEAYDVMVKGFEIGSDPPDLKCPPEVEVAAEWWRRQLVGNSVMDNGDDFQSAFGTLVATMAPAVSELQAQRFAAWIGFLFTRLNVLENDGWRANQPDYGGYMRCLEVDYGPGVVLKEALNLSRIDHHNTRLPIKTTMLVNPGSVRVGKGYGRPFETIYSKCGMVQSES